jgi:alpha-amylase
VQNPFDFVPTDQTRGYYPFEIWYNGQNLAATALQAWTYTGITYVNHTGPGEANWSWNYSHFHPVDSRDYLGFPGTDEVIPNTKFFGNDLNTFDPVVQDRLITWGQWLTNTVGFDGYRLDFVRGYQPEFAAQWIKSMPKRSNGQQRFAVAEYWGSKAAIKNWVTTVESLGADIDAFDFPLKFTLTDMANRNGADWNMSWLNHAGLVRDNSGNALSGTQVVTFVENHDTGKEHDKWLWRDWDMAYAYILFAEGRPKIFYPHFYGIPQHDHSDPSITVQAPASLRQDLIRLIKLRRNYLGGTMVVLSQVGNPWPAADVADVFVARRGGNGIRSGAILVLNDHETDTKGLWVDSSPSGWPNWAGKVLINPITGATSQIYADGRVYVWAPPRSYAIWILRDEYEPGLFASLEISEGVVQVGEQALRLETLPTDFFWNGPTPNPFAQHTCFELGLRESAQVQVVVYDLLGRAIQQLVHDTLPAGRHQVHWEARHLASGPYVVRLIVETVSGQRYAQHRLVFLRQ